MVKKENIKQIIAETAVNIQSEAKSRVPVDTGNLKNSMNMQLFNNGLSAEISNSAEYASHVEFGTRRSKAQPYLFPAYEANVKKYVAELNKELRRK